jgi:hypothetical protein
MYTTVLIHSLVLECLSYFQNLAIVNSAVINMGMQVAQLYPGLHSFGYIPRSGGVDCMVGLFLFLRSLHIAFHSGCTKLQSQQKYVRVTFLLYTCQHLLLFVLLMIAILNEWR